jgi:hypothetical protein
MRSNIEELHGLHEIELRLSSVAKRDARVLGEPRILVADLTPPGEVKEGGRDLRDDRLALVIDSLDDLGDVAVDQHRRVICSGAVTAGECAGSEPGVVKVTREAEFGVHPR